MTTRWVALRAHVAAEESVRAMARKLHAVERTESRHGLSDVLAPLTPPRPRPVRPGCPPRRARRPVVPDPPRRAGRAPCRQPIGRGLARCHAPPARGPRCPRGAPAHARLRRQRAALIPRPSRPLTDTTRHPHEPAVRITPPWCPAHRPPGAAPAAQFRIERHPDQPCSRQRPAGAAEPALLGARPHDGALNLGACLAGAHALRRPGLQAPGGGGRGLEREPRPPFFFVSPPTRGTAQFRRPRAANCASATPSSVIAAPTIFTRV